MLGCAGALCLLKEHRNQCIQCQIMEKPSTMELLQATHVFVALSVPNTAGHEHDKVLALTSPGTTPVLISDQKPDPQKFRLVLLSCPTQSPIARLCDLKQAGPNGQEVSKRTLCDHVPQQNCMDKKAQKTDNHCFKLYLKIPFSHCLVVQQ